MRELARLGLWTTAHNRLPAAEFSRAVSCLDSLSFGQVWVGEGGGRDPYLSARRILGSCALPVGIGVANIYARASTTAIACERDLVEEFGDRLISGFGVSHPSQNRALGHGPAEGSPLKALRQYFEELSEADDSFVGAGGTPPSRVVAALGPRMLRLGRSLAAGVHTYCVPATHTATAREALGPEPWLIVEHAIVVDSAQAEALSEAYVAQCLTRENYVINLRRLGFTERDFLPRPSKRLIDSLVATTPAAIQGAVAAQLAAGASQVCVQVLDDRVAPDPTASWAKASRLLEKLVA